MPYAHTGSGRREGPPQPIKREEEEGRQDHQGESRKNGNKGEDKEEK